MIVNHLCQLDLPLVNKFVFFACFRLPQLVSWWILYCVSLLTAVLALRVLAFGADTSIDVIFYASFGNLLEFLLNFKSFNLGFSLFPDVDPILFIITFFVDWLLCIRCVHLLPFILLLSYINYSAELLSFCILCAFTNVWLSILLLICSVVGNFVTFWPKLLIYLCQLIHFILEFVCSSFQFLLLSIRKGHKLLFVMVSWI